MRERQAANRPVTLKAKAKAKAEDKRFSDRKQFGLCRLWTTDPEPRSLIPSTWPAFEEAIRKYGLPFTQKRIWT